jgi:uncharacterized protein YigE (DUF2233 family)
MNGGMYQDDFQPVGLHVENGRELTRANTVTLTGAPSAIPNFFKKPNGVFYIANGVAGILDCGNALFLDGGVASGLYAPGLGRNDAPGHGGYGPIIAVVD